MAAKTSIASTLAHTLRDSILRGQIPPNAKLRLEDLSASYGVSLSPVREALLRLMGEGLVVGEDQRGFRVAEASIQNLAEVTALRSHLEPFALRLAIEHGNSQWEENLVAIFHRLTRIEKQNGYVLFLDEWEQTHRDFHLGLVAGCGMPMLLHFCSMLHDLSDRYRRLFLQEHPPLRNVAQEHGAIFEAVLARDADKACGLLLEHMQSTGHMIMAFMQQRVRPSVATENTTQIS
jgi:GntR family carbon starvation induced transcriptional regulator